jgi:hypothetical protein
MMLIRIHRKTKEKLYFIIYAMCFIIKHFCKQLE